MRGPYSARPVPDLNPAQAAADTRAQLEAEFDAALEDGAA